jgi:hypothetical protein
MLLKFKKWKLIKLKSLKLSPNLKQNQFRKRSRQKVKARAEARVLVEESLLPMPRRSRKMIKITRNKQRKRRSNLK